MCPGAQIDTVDKWQNPGWWRAVPFLQLSSQSGASKLCEAHQIGQNETIHIYSHGQSQQMLYCL